MFFSKKNKKEELKCNQCKSKIGDEYSFCPYCGNVLVDFEKDTREFGMLGKDDLVENPAMGKFIAENNLSITDKMISALVSSLMKNLDSQFKEIDKSSVGNQRGIKIKIGLPMDNQQKKRAAKHDFSHKKITEDQIKKMSELPRVSAKTNIKRIGDKVIYELEASGVQSVQDVFVSKLETGYEVKAIGEKKVYVNSLPINLPITSFSLGQDRLFLEFSGQQQ